MLNIEKTQSDNSVYMSGVLNELDITTGQSKDGKEWIRGTAVIKCDQEINGVPVECLGTVKMFSMRLKKDGDLNKVYDRILGYKEKFTSEAAADEDHPASKVTVTGQLEENIWVDSSTGKERSTFQISSNFLNDKREGDEDGIKFQLSGVVLNDPTNADEIDKNDEPTGRIRIKFGVIGYGGKIHVLDLYASDGAKSHIQDSWNKEDTVKVTGRVNVTKKIEQIEEKQGFGESIIKTRTISTKELIITGGSASGLEEELSYDSDSIKKALGDRRAKIDELIENSKNSISKAAPKNKSTDFGF